MRSEAREREDQAIAAGRVIARGAREFAQGPAGKGVAAIEAWEALRPDPGEGVTEGETHALARLAQECARAGSAELLARACQALARRPLGDGFWSSEQERLARDLREIGLLACAYDQAACARAAVEILGDLGGEVDEMVTRCCGNGSAKALATLFEILPGEQRAGALALAARGSVSRAGVSCAEAVAAWLGRDLELDAIAAREAALGAVDGASRASAPVCRQVGETLRAVMAPMGREARLAGLELLVERGASRFDLNEVWPNALGALAAEREALELDREVGRLGSLKGEAGAGAGAPSRAPRI